MYVFQIAVEHSNCCAYLLYAEIDKHQWDHKYSNILLCDFSIYNSGKRCEYIIIIIYIYKYY